MGFFLIFSLFFKQGKQLFQTGSYNIIGLVNLAVVTSMIDLQKPLNHLIIWGSFNKKSYWVRRHSSPKYG